MQQRLEFGFNALDAALTRAAGCPIDDRFAPLAESLLWVVMLNDAFWKSDQEGYTLVRDADEVGKTIEGFRYARHRLVHDMSVYGMHGQMEGGVWGRSNWDQAVLGIESVWAWRTIDDLDEWNHEQGEQTYRDYLEGRPVAQTLEAAGWFLLKYRDDMTTIIGVQGP